MRFLLKGLNRQILTITLTITMGASIIIGMIALMVFYQYSKEQVLARNLEIAGSICNDIDRMMSKAQLVGNALAADPEIRKLDPELVQGNLERLFNATEVFDGISIIDKNGKIIAFMPETPGVVGLDLSARGYFQQVMATGTQVVSDPYKAATGNNLVVVASPVRDQNGKIAGVLSGSINLKKERRFSTIIDSHSHNPGMVIQLIDKQGKIIYHPDRDLIMKNADHNLAVQALLRGESGAKDINIQNNRVFTGYSSSSKLGWGVLVEYPADKALYSAMRLRNLMIFFTVLICLLVFLVALIVSRAISKPLQMLVAGVQRVSEGDYHINLDIKSPNEIGVLADSFNSMVERIKVMTEDILNKQEDLEKANIELQVMAITDGLTKLYNHRYFQDCLEKAVTLAQQENKSVTLMILDIDHFKYYNDLFGHQAGDKLLEELAQLLIRELGPNDMVARYGGEEFTVILYDSGSENGVNVAEKVRAAVEAFPFPGRDQQPDGKITVSIGVASYPENARAKEELIRLADEALYKAKCCSRNKVELYFSVLDDLIQDLNQSELELINSIKMLIRIINAKDKYTYGHSERVGRYAVAIARALGLNEEDIRTIRMGAFLHDVGKIEISRSILMKKGPLTEEEFSIIKKHPFWGAGIIKAVESLSPTLPLIKFHHEHFNGKGYPLGLKGRQIPLHARIMAVADSFDAMTSNRPYSKRKNMEEAVKEIRRCSGTQFDPEIVDAFIRVLEEESVNVG